MAGAGAAGVSLPPTRPGCQQFYKPYLYSEGRVRVWPYARANGEHTVNVLRRLRAEVPDGKLIVVWDDAPYHRH